MAQQKVVLAILFCFLRQINGSEEQNVVEAEMLQDPRIVGGRPATLQSAKHQVSIRLKVADDNWGFGQG